MGVENYRVLFEGQITDGSDPDAVKARLAQLFRKSVPDIEALFSGKPRVLKTVRNLEDGQRLVAAIARAGAVAKLESSFRHRKSKNEGEAQDLTILEPAGFRYRMNITAAALAVGTVWLVHLLVLVSLSAALLYHLIFNLDFYGMFGVAGLLFHTLPAVLGAAFIVVLIKPLLPVRGGTTSEILLDSSRQPHLDEFLKDICRQLGAPVPHCIAVDSGAGIALNFGALPEIPSRRFTLQLGLTLVSGLTVRQFAGLLGRELGYLGRKQAARRTQFVRASHQRLRQAVFGKDEVDRLLENLEKQPGFRAVFGHIGQKLLAFSRGLHCGLYKIVTTISSGPLRLVQFRLDRVQAQLSGSDAFRGTLSMQHLLKMTFKAAADGEEQKWFQKGELTAHLPAAALFLARQHVEQFQSEIRRVMQGGIARMDDSCPTDLKRIERIEKNPQKALYTDVRAAHQLLSGFECLSRRTSYLYYRGRLLVPITPDRLSSVNVEPTKAERLLRSYLFDLHRAPVPISQPLPEGNTEALRLKLRDKSLDSTEWRTSIYTSLQYYFEIERQLVEANTREVLVAAKIPLPEGEVDLESIYTECRELENEEEKALKKLKDSAQAPSQRLAIGLAYLDIAASEGIREEVDRLRAALRRTDDVLPKLRSLHLHSTILELLLSYAPLRNHALKDRVDERTRDVHQLLLAIRLNLREAPWPFGATTRGDNLAKHAVDGHFDEAGPYELLDIAGTALSRTQAIRQQILARLVQLSVSAEKRLLGN